MKKRFINTKVVVDIATDQVLEREGYDYEGPVAQAVAATAVTKLIEDNLRGAQIQVFSFSIDCGSVTATTQEIETIAVTGARTGDPCSVVLEAPPAGLITTGAKVTANDVVSFYVGGSTTVDAAALIGYLTIYKRTIAA